MKILLIRLSSIGDIVLTTPVIRCLKKQLPDAEIHYLTKKAYAPLLEANPYLSRILTMEKSIREVEPLIKEEQYTHIIDLHKNWRTVALTLRLRRRFHTFNKLNKKKWLLVNFKINLLPPVHITERYLKAVSFLGIQNDHRGLDYFIPPAEQKFPKAFPENFRNKYVAVVAGAKQFTKQIPSGLIISLLDKIPLPAVIIGGKEDRNKAEEIKNHFSEDKVFNACGLCNLNQSAFLIHKSELVITADTGMMHIAAGLHKKILSIWGNTVPEFGMYPLYPEGMENLGRIAEIKGLPCRPCTKLGKKKCPKKHFLCMNGHDEYELLQLINELLQQNTPADFQDNSR